METYDCADASLVAFAGADEDAWLAGVGRVQVPEADGVVVGGRGYDCRVRRGDFQVADGLRVGRG